MKKTKKTAAATRAARKPARPSRPSAGARAEAENDEKLPPVIGTGPAIAVIACIVTFVGAIALVPSRETPRQTDAVAAAPAETPAAAAPKPRTKPEAPKTDGKIDVKAEAARKTLVDPVRIVPVEPVGALVADAAPGVAPAEPIQTRPVATVASVTITGCLVHEDETFWLSDTSGADAPTARSWKSGFLKKRPSRIELVDRTNALKLPAYVGRRIAATGTLVNREMQTHSLHPLGMSCS